MIGEGKKVYYTAMELLQVAIVIGVLILFSSNAKEIKKIFIEDVNNKDVMEETNNMYRYRIGAEVTGVDIVELIGEYDTTYKYVIINNKNSIRVRTNSGGLSYSKENYMNNLGSSIDVVGTAGVNRLVKDYKLEDITDKVFKDSLNKVYRVVEMPVDIIGGSSRADISNEFMFVLEE